jgi:lysophospholipase L1-like esterase
VRPERTIGRLKSGEETVIVALGDSLTRGWMVRKGYLDFLAEMLGARYPGAKMRIINQGIPGDTAEGGLERLRGDVVDLDPHCTLVQFALNDAFIGYPAERFKNNVQAIIDGLRSGTESEIVLVTSVYIHEPRENDMAERFYAKLDDLASEYSLPIARVHERWKKRVMEGTRVSALVQYDGVHPTVEGYGIMAEAVMELFQ